MTAALTILAVIGLFAAGINVGEIIKGTTTKGWAFGLGLLALVGFGYLAIAS